VTTVSGCGTNSINTKLRYKRLAKEAEAGDVTPVAEYTVYPNPTTGMVSVEASSGFESVSQILVYNGSGKICRKIDVPAKPENIYSFDLGDQPNGYYIVKIVGADFLKQFKVLVSR
jgi:type 1 fimbria pilin